MKAIVNTKLVLEDGIIWNGAVTFENGRIVECGKSCDVHIPDGTEIINANGLYTAPGLIDIHNHGGPDELFAANTENCVKHVLKHGVTKVLPTFYCDMSVSD
ncbi:MAG: hypothetical protein J5879_00075, partial [Clostridia bacterium]|nr:hypothetical protein [Clostridia bacterium]